MRNISDKELDELIKCALHSEADYTEINAELKLRINEEIARRSGNSVKVADDFATVCLDLFEYVEDKAKKEGIVIRCLPADEAFGKNISLDESTYRALEFVLSEIVLMFGDKADKVFISTEKNTICVKGLRISKRLLVEFCRYDSDRKLVITDNNIGIAFAYLHIRGIDISVPDDERMQFIFNKVL